MKQTNAIIGLLAQTSIHAGTGQNTGVIDLPIQREGHNGWPCVFGSAVKGALRSRAEQKHGAKDDDGKDNPSITYVFGPTTNNAEEHAGAISVSDARLLLLPVRSLTSQFKWVTCPSALKRYQQDASRFSDAASSANMLNDIELNIDEDKALAVADVANKDKQVFLEEYRFTLEEADLSEIITALLPLMTNVDKETLEKQLIIINDDNFSYMAQHVTPVNAHIAIDSDTKIVKKGALWYEETLPPETLLYIGIHAVASRLTRNQENESIHNDAQQTLNAVTDLFSDNNWLQLGGNETVGMGWCAVAIQTAEQDNSKGE